MCLDERLNSVCVGAIYTQAKIEQHESSDLQEMVALHSSASWYDDQTQRQFQINLLLDHAIPNHLSDIFNEAVNIEYSLAEKMRHMGKTWIFYHHVQQYNVGHV